MLFGSPAGETSDLWALLCVIFSYVFVTFPYRDPGQVGYIIVSIPDLCLPYFYVLHVFEAPDIWVIS